MLKLWRRHVAACPHRAKGRRFRACPCPLQATGTLRGVKVRKSLDMTSWDAAQAVLRDWEAIGAVTGEAVTIEEAVERFLADGAARELKEATLQKLRLFLHRQLMPFCAERGIRFVGQCTVDVLRAFRETWDCAPVTKVKRLERMRTFFAFAKSSKWILDNPAKDVKVGRVQVPQTQPFTDPELVAIASAIDRYPKKNSMGYDNRARLRALVALLRYGGLRIGDAVAFDYAKLDGYRLFLYTHKTGTPVYVPLPEHAVESLNVLRHLGARPFWSGEGKLKSAISHWQRVLPKLFELAAVEGGHSHKFRHTFSVKLLEAGVPLEDVALLLGHSSPAVTAKHYSAFVKARRDRLEERVKAAWV